MCGCMFVAALRVCNFVFAVPLDASVAALCCCGNVLSFLFVLGTKGRMQPVVMAPKNLCAVVVSRHESIY